METIKWAYAVHNPHVAEEILVHHIASDGLQISMLSTSRHGYTATESTSQGYALQLRPKVPQVGALEAEWQALEGAGFFRGGYPNTISLH